MSLSKDSEYKNPNYLSTRYKYLLKQTWYSICSAHQTPKPNCRLCKVGTWEYNIFTTFSDSIYKLNKKLWIKIVNRKENVFKVIFKHFFCI